MKEYPNKKEIIGKFDHKKWKEIETQRKRKSEALPLNSKENKPIRFLYVPKLIDLISQIEKERGFLSSLQLPKTFLKDLSSIAINEEAYYSSHIEGAVTSLQEALLNFKSRKRSYADESMQMIYNNKKALKYMLKQKEKQFSHEIVYKLQEILVYNTHKEKPITSGEYRHGPIYVVDGMGRLIYEGPPANKVYVMMDSFLEWLNKENNLHPLLKAGITHLYFVQIHPFDDGNGRSARALSNLLLAKSGYQFINFLSPSNYFDHNRSAYYKSIRDVEKHDYDSTYFLLYYLNALFAQLEKIKNEIAKGCKVKNIKDIINRDTYIQLNKRQVKALKFMLEKEDSISTKKFCKINKCSDETARKDFNQLINMQVVKALGQGRSRVYTFIM